MRIPALPRWLIPALVVLALAALCAQLLRPAEILKDTTKPSYSASRQEAITPIPLGLTFDADQVALGRRLFNDPRLSRDGRSACSNCHNLKLGGADGLQRAKELGVNTPSVLNAGFNFRQFWDGRASSLEQQIDLAVTGPLELASSWDVVLATIASDPVYQDEFLRVTGRAVDRAAVQAAIATYERSLITPNARFDRFLRGEKDALSSEEFAGYELFQNLGCIACHQGMNIGGNMFEEIGLVEDYFAMRGQLTPADEGLFNYTGKKEDRRHFRVPSLRNVALTAPYFHDGYATTLEQAVTLMARFQLGLRLTEDETQKLVKFLRTLTGDIPGEATP